MLKTPLCRSTAYLSGLKEEISDIKKQLTDIKDEIVNLQCIKSKLLLLQSNQKEEGKLIEHNLKSNEANRQRIESELSTKIEELRDMIIHERNLQTMTNSTRSANFESELKICEKRCNDIEEKIIPELINIKTDIAANCQEIVNLSNLVSQESTKIQQQINDDLGKVYATLNNNSAMLIELIHQKHKVIEEYQQKQENSISERFTKLQEAISKKNSELNQQILEQSSENRRLEQLLLEEISNLKSALVKIENESISNLRKLIEDNHIDIKAGQKIQQESFKEYFQLLETEFSKRIKELQDEFSTKLTQQDSVQKNQLLISEQNLQHQVQEVHQKLSEKLENNLSLIMTLFDDKFKTLENRQINHENSFVSDCSALIDEKLSEVNENFEQKICQQKESQEKVIFACISDLKSHITKIENESNHQKEEFQKICLDLEEKFAKTRDLLQNEISHKLIPVEENLKNLSSQNSSLKEHFENEWKKLIDTVNNDLSLIKSFEDKFNETVQDHQETRESFSERITNLEEKIPQKIEELRLEIDQQWTEYKSQQETISAQISTINADFEKIENETKNLGKLFDDNREDAKEHKEQIDNLTQQFDNCVVNLSEKLSKCQKIIENRFGQDFLDCHKEFAEILFEKLFNRLEEAINDLIATISRIKDSSENSDAKTSDNLEDETSP